MRILLLNQGHTNNIGDKAINQVLLFHIKSKLPMYDVINVPFWDEKLMLSSNSFINAILSFFPLLMRCVSSWRIKKVINKDKEEIKAIIIGGGELLSEHKGFACSIIFWSKYAQKRNIPIFMVGVSGQLKMPIGLKKRNALLKKYNSIFVRDLDTLNQLKKGGINSLFFPDVVFALDTASYSLDKKKDSLICIPVAYTKKIGKHMNLRSEMQYLEYIKREIESHISYGALKVYFMSTVDSDYRYVEKVFSYVSSQLQTECYILPYSPYLVDFFQILNHADTVISCRMHALILGALFNSNLVAIPIRSKLNNFQKLLLDYSNNINNLKEMTLFSLELLCMKVSESLSVSC